MSKHGGFMAEKHVTAVIFLALVGTSAQEAVASSELVGLWSAASCASVDDLEYQGRTLTAYSADDAVYIMPQFITEIEPGLYLSVTEESGIDKYPFFARRGEAELVQYWPKEELASDEDARVFFETATSEEFDSGAVLQNMEEIRLQPCPGLPFEYGLAFGEAFSVLKSLDEAVFQCRTDLEGCPKSLFDMVDITDNGALSVAEMARLFRAATLLGSAADDSASKPGVGAVAAVSASLAPIAAAGVLHSFDYDRSGDLSFGELFSDRLPQVYQSGSSMSVSAKDFIGMISGAAESASGLGAILMR
jgi:hypothetical protein